MKTTLLSLLLALAAPAALQAQYDYSTNADGGIYTYTNNPDGTITLAGYSGPPWAVAIPATINGLTVTSIGDNAFHFHTNLTSVIIPFGVTSIGEQAFEFCLNLTNVAIPDSVITISDHAFAGANLSSVAIPASITNIGRFAFTGSNLATITVDPQNLTYSSLDGVVFDKSGCTLLLCPQGAKGNYNIPGSVTNIGLEAFWGCRALTTVTITGTVTSIGGGAFGLCSGLTNITLLNGIGNIGANVFPECTNLRSITIPASVTNIGDTAFSGCTSLANITIPASVTALGWRAFADCQSLVAVYVLGNAPTCDPNEFIYDSNVTVYYLPGTTGWSNTFAGVPALLWNPVIQTGDNFFGVRNQQFGFNITGTLNIPIAVEVTTNLGSPLWTPLQSLLLTNGLFYFSDSQWTNRAAGYYRISSP